MPPDGGAQKVQHGGYRLQKKYLILQTLHFPMHRNPFLFRSHLSLPRLMTHRRFLQNLRPFLSF